MSQGPSLRTPLGQVMHLNGALPRGTDARTVVPKRCPCGVLFLAIGKGAARTKFCGTCRATQTCRSCNHVGGHAPRCAKGRVRPCHGCGDDLGHGHNRSYCDTCRADQCPGCKRFAGQHEAKCDYRTRRRHAPSLTEYRGVVTEADVVAVYLEHGAKAVRLARSICGTLHAEDVVHDLVLYLLEKRDYLRFPPNEAYVLRAVKHGALRKLIYGWHRYTVAMDPEDLAIAEQAMAREGRPAASRVVRLPSAP